VQPSIRCGSGVLVTTAASNLEYRMLTVSWVKSTNNEWLSLEHVNLTNVATRGVYIIWHRGNPSRVVRVGQGVIADRLSAHRQDPKILAYARLGLRVTWAAVPAAQRDGVERHLADTWNPLVGDAFPDVAPIAVNSPWG
jgi:hypothetical protein